MRLIVRLRGGQDELPVCGGEAVEVLKAAEAGNDSLFSVLAAAANSAFTIIRKITGLWPTPIHERCGSWF